MDRHAAPILTSLALVLAAVLAAGCSVDFYTDLVDPAPATPIQVYLQDTWDTTDGYLGETSDGVVLPDGGGESGRILRCMDEWNFRFREETGSDQPIIVYAGLHHDPDGFTVDDLKDGRIVIYKTDDSVENEDVLEMFSAAGYTWETNADAVRADTLPPDPSKPGYESSGEVLVFTDRFENRARLHSDYLAHLWYSTCHELGHVLGLFHEESGPSVMHEYEPWSGTQDPMAADELQLMDSMGAEMLSPYRPAETMVYPIDAEDLCVRGICGD